MSEIDFSPLPLTRRWERGVDYGAALMRPSFVVGELLICQYYKAICAFDLESGELTWEYRLAGELYGVFPGGAGLVAYMEDADGMRLIMGLDLTGQDVWLMDSPVNFTDRNIDCDGTRAMHFGASNTDKGAAIILDAQTGKEITRIEDFKSTNLLHGDGLISGSDSGSKGGLRRVDANGTTDLWTEGPTDILGRKSSLIFSHVMDRNWGNPRVMAFDLAAGAVRWIQTMNVDANFASDETHIYFQERDLSRTLKIHAIKVDSGDLAWSTAVDFNSSTGQLTRHDDHLIWAYDMGELALFDPQDGALRAKTAARVYGAVAPAMRGAHLYFTNHEKVGSYEWTK